MFEPSAMRGARLRHPVAALLVALLALNSAPPPARGHGFRAAIVSPSPSPSTPSAGAAVPGLDAFIAVAEQFVSSHRGLDYSAPVQVTLLDDAAFQDRIAADVRSSASDYQKEGKVLAALGLVPAGTDLAQLEETFVRAGVLGYYDPRSKQLVVRGGQLTVSVRHVVVHELTHALQDQHFDLTKRPTGDDERDLAFTGLVEGDAVRIENEYIASLSAADRAELRREEAASIPDFSSVPMALIEIDLFPYRYGPPFVQTLVLRRGQAGLDAAFKSPPTTSAQLIHPELYLDGTGASDIATPAASGTVVDRGSLGEMGFEILLQQLVGGGGLTTAALKQAAAEWQGDRYVAWQSGDSTCVRDSVAGGADLHSALLKLAASRSGMTVSDEVAGFSFTSCG